MNITTAPLAVVPVARRAGWLVVAAGLLLFLAGTFESPERGASALLISSFYFVTLALGGVTFLAMMYAGKAGWSAGIKRIPEAFSTFLPFGALALLCTLPELKTLYAWARPEVLAHDAVLRGKAAYLNPTFFSIRMVVILAGWMVFAWLLRRNSLRQDRVKGTEPTSRNVALSCGFLVFGAVTLCIASFDWIMSLEPRWYSTIFGFYNIAGMLEGAAAGITVAAILMHRQHQGTHVNESHLHDLGKLMFAFAVFWAYQWFSQYLLIWYANLPEEIPYYLRRTEGGWAPVFWGNFIINFVVPFLALLPRGAKRSETHLLAVGIWMLAGRFLDIFLMVMPSNAPVFPGFGMADLGAFMLLGGAFTLVTWRSASRVPLLPLGDPYLGESLHHHI